MPIDICPRPPVWAAIHERLVAASRGATAMPEPPRPLILAGWAATNDVEKQRRWQETLAWATRHGFSTLIGGLPRSSMYCVEHPSEHQVGPKGGPMYLDWTFTPKPKPSALERSAALETLRRDWSAVAGPELAATTMPLRLTGSKGRRLLVAASDEAEPPWGTWTSRHSDERRSHFTKFRAAINAAIAPLAVDHIDFVITAARDG